MAFNKTLQLNASVNLRFVFCLVENFEAKVLRCLFALRLVESD
jgi:hypothetical protein